MHGKTLETLNWIFSLSTPDTRIWRFFPAFKCCRKTVLTCSLYAHYLFLPFFGQIHGNILWPAQGMCKVLHPPQCTPWLRFDYSNCSEMQQSPTWASHTLGKKGKLRLLPFIHGLSWTWVIVTKVPCQGGNGCQILLWLFPLLFFKDK